MTAGSLSTLPPARSAHRTLGGLLRGTPLAVLMMLSLSSFVMGCKGSVKAEAKASSSGQSEVDFDAGKKRDEAWESEALPASNAAASKPSAPAGQRPAGPVAMLGARHDLTATGNPAPACQCLVVLAGEPTRPGLAWSGTPPEIDAKTQLAVALTSDQVSCPTEVPRASYMGYEVRDANVVIQVEGAVAGRPLTQGAIVPRPMTGGKLVIESTSGLPYGKPISGSGSCTVSY